MIQVEWFYWLIGLFFLLVGVLVARDRTNPRRVTSGVFWALLGLCFPYSSFVVAKTLPAWPLGLTIVVIAAIAGTGRLAKSGSATQATVDGDVEGADLDRDATGSERFGRGLRSHRTDPDTGSGTGGSGPGVSGSEGGVGVLTQITRQREAFAERFGNKLFIPVLTIPILTALCATLGPKIKIGGQPLFHVGSETVIGLAAAGLIAIPIGMYLFRQKTPAIALTQGRRLTEDLGWALVLPQLLSVLGLVFATAGVGKAIGTTVSKVLPDGSLLPAVILYCLGMAIFTVIMGNAFAAFPVMTAAIGYPVLVAAMGGNPPVIFAIGMLSGYCGTLCTPMAANFNIVPVALLELKSNYAVIRQQIPTAIPLLVANIVLMYVIAF
ncbi:MAG: rane protein [Friedmanniella sp.]|nr:rane protein [Friedmanniella sp.]